MGISLSLDLGGVALEIKSIGGFLNESRMFKPSRLETKPTGTDD
jgi:hypothetical protein